MAVCALGVKHLARVFNHGIRAPVISNLDSYFRLFHFTSFRYKEEHSSQLVVKPSVFQVHENDRNKKTFLEAVKIYTNRPGPRRGHVEFIYSALKYMEEFGVHKDLEAYKNILDILPKGQYIPTNMFQAELFHYPKQQECVLDLLEQMEENGVCPDAETEQMMLNIFGRHARPTKKLMRMSYWMPKFRNLSPWSLYNEVPINDTLEAAKLAVRRMMSVDPATEIDVFDTKDLVDAVDGTWIVSGQNTTQRELLAKLAEKQTVYVEGAFTIWMNQMSLNYFILRADPLPPSEEELKLRSEFDYDDVSKLRSWILGDESPSPKELVVQPSVHEQEDGTILAVGITGSCSKDSLLSWIRFLERKNPNLANLSVLFATHSPLGEIVPAIGSSVPAASCTKVTEGSNT